MEPITITLLVVAAITAGAAVRYWAKILEWGMTSLLTWVQGNAPGLEQPLRVAFTNLDKVMVPVYNAAKDAWVRIRHVLEEQIQTFERLANGTWRLTVLSKLREGLGGATNGRVPDHVTQEDVRYEDLPPEVRDHWLRNGLTRYSINVTEARDAEFKLQLSA